MSMTPCCNKTPTTKERFVSRDYKMKRIIVTGGAGFIGSHVCKRLLADGCDVTAIDNFDPFYPREDKLDNISDIRGHSRFHFLGNDIREGEPLAQALHGTYECIVHLAAKAGVRPSISDPQAYQSTNVGGTQVVLELARKLGVKQFVFASSSSVYGVNPNVPWREDDHVLLPISPYASTKVSCELLGHVYAHLYGLRVVCLRFFTVYGPHQRPDLAIRKFASLMLNEKPIPVYGDGSTRRDYTYVEDIVQGVIAASEYSRSQYEIFNIGNNRTISLNQMIAELESALGVKARIEHKPEQVGDVPQTFADIEKAKCLLDYAPATSFERGISAFAAWFMSQKRPAKRVA